MSNAFAKAGFIDALSFAFILAILLKTRSVGAFEAGKGCKNRILIEYFRIEYYYLKGFEYHYLLISENRIANIEYFRIAFEYQLFAQISNISNTPPSSALSKLW